MSEGPVLIVAAMTSEARPVARRLGLRPARGRGVIAYVGSRGGRAVRLVIVGMGRRRAVRAAEAELEAVDPSSVLIIGFAGGLNPRLEPAEVLVLDAVTDAADGSTFRPARRVATAGTLLTADRPALDPEAKARLYRRWACDAVDMESAPLAALCERRGTPWLCVRAISDPADASLPPFAEHLVRPDGRADGLAALRCVLIRPRRIGAMLRLGRHARATAESLADQLAKLLP